MFSQDLCGIKYYSRSSCIFNTSRSQCPALMAAAKATNGSFIPVTLKCEIIPAPRKRKEPHPTEPGRFVVNEVLAYKHHLLYIKGAASDTHCA